MERVPQKGVIPNALLVGCGGTVFVANAVLYVLLRDIAKFHGAVQVGMSAIGLVMLIIGSTGRVIVHMRREKN